MSNEKGFYVLEDGAATQLAAGICFLGKMWHNTNGYSFFRTAGGLKAAPLSVSSPTNIFSISRMEYNL
ncbi:MAG: hypothetical protein LBV79_12415 [Candidatus Adiutrix sp.]|nr:hypothetical protein [Candidatus Adiutrix sp.]